MTDEICVNKISTNLDLTVRIAQNNENYYIFAFNYSNNIMSGEITVEGEINKTLNVSVEPSGTQIMTIKKAVY